MNGLQGDERGGSKAISFTMNSKVKQVNKYGEQGKKISGDQGNSTIILGI